MAQHPQRAHPLEPRARLGPSTRIPYRVLGSSRCSVLALRALLGELAFAVWSYLLACRVGDDGECCVSVGELTARFKRSHRACKRRVEHALATLVSLHLCSGVRRELPSELRGQRVASSDKRWRCWRTVYGQLGEVHEPATIPGEAMRRVTAAVELQRQLADAPKPATRRGGKRVGAGRPKGSKNGSHEPLSAQLDTTTQGSENQAVLQGDEGIKRLRLKNQTPAVEVPPEIKAVRDYEKKRDTESKSLNTGVQGGSQGSPPACEYAQAHASRESDEPHLPPSSPLAPPPDLPLLPQKGVANAPVNPRPTLDPSGPSGARARALPAKGLVGVSPDTLLRADLNAPIRRLPDDTDMARRHRLFVAMRATGQLDRDVEAALTGNRSPLVPHVDVDKVARCVVPAMPTLDPLDTTERHASLVVAWYKHAFQLVFGKACWVFGRGHVTESRYYRLVREACEAFVERDIAPAAWILWSMRQWKDSPQGQRIDAPPNFVLHPTRIRQPRGWHSGEGASAAIKRLLRVDAARELSLAQLAMRDAIVSRIPLTADEVRAIVDEFFPLDLHTTLTNKARAEAEAMSAELASRVYAGKWVWLWPKVVRFCSSLVRPRTHLCPPLVRLPRTTCLPRSSVLWLQRRVRALPCCVPSPTSFMPKGSLTRSQSWRSRQPSTFCATQARHPLRSCWSSNACKPW